MADTDRQETTTSAQDITALTWIVERSFAWLGRNRRLSKDYEYRVQTSETMIDLAAIRLMLNRIALETFQTPSEDSRLAATAISLLYEC